MIKEDSLISDIKEHFNTLLNARSLAISNDERVLEFLLVKSSFKNEYKERFFQTQYGAIIFKKDEFLNFLDLRLLSHSYTSFSNKIGLGASEKKFLKNSQNVVLNFPFKDCVLKGSQSKDDDKNTELFFNNILAKSEIDLLFAPKVLNKFELIGGGDLETTLKNRPNLLIKGNNLIALHSLKEYFRHQSEQNKVKLIYIDPPYNTGSDSFNYNDRFNHSTYLTFMKNRLEIARELLRDDGVIFVQCDDNEQAYLKVLMDEIFGRENFVSCLVWANKEGGGKSDSKYFRKKHEYILCFAKKKEMLIIYPQDVEDIERYTLSDKHEAERGKYQLIKLDSGSLGWVKSLDYPIELNGITFYAGGSKEKWQDRQNGGASIKDWGWRWSKEKLEWGLKNDFIVTKQNNKGEWNIYTKQYLNCDNNGNLKPRTIQPMALLERHSNTQSNKHMKELFDKVAFNYSKFEGLIMDILKFATQENDLVLDFFAGSGTTLAVAHKMKRRYIGIEQMEYIESITKERLKKVIEGEQGGISKAVSWSGGGNLIYCELASLNAKFIEKIENSSDENELNQIYENLQKIAFIDYRVDIKNDLKDDEFSNLDFINKKRILKKCLDRNMDYIPYADIDDSEYKIDERAKKLNKIFYGENDG
ncbi:site-specific DNA-methyltransferase [Campylobacter lanienae]|uniref:site-specific DNA-methyltransferase n=1 Tax=Campylobacter lanienae TaxID=75658 RepID=UPI000BB40AE8|nr:site-specific DNA-methyltransferase [Campylobacter lanienae]